MKQFSAILLSLAALFALAAATRAQTATSAPRTMVTSDRGIAPVIPSMLEPVITGGLLDGILVRNKPVTAVLQSETVETRADGTSAPARRVVTRIYRDGEGRVRREQIFYQNGATPSPTDAAQTITIYDPVARWNYSLDPVRRTASRHRLPATPATSTVFGNQMPAITRIFRNNSPNGTTTAYTLLPPVVQSLGKQTIAGVEADGWRVTLKVPAGALGNAAQMDAVYETWIAADLQMLVKCVAGSPASGTQTLVTTSLNRTEPARALFEIPAGYTMIEMGVKRTDLPPPINNQ